VDPHVSGMVIAVVTFVIAAMLCILALWLKPVFLAPFNVAAIVALEVTYLTKQVVGRSGAPIATTMTPLMQHRIALNPDYSMDIRISTETPPCTNRTGLAEPHRYVGLGFGAPGAVDYHS